MSHWFRPVRKLRGVTRFPWPILGLTGRMGRARLPAPGAALRAPARGHGGTRLPCLGDALGVGAMAEQEAAPDAPPAPDTGAGRQGGEPPGAVDR